MSNSEMQAERGGVAAAGAEGPPWLSFRVHERILASGDLYLLQRLEDTYRQLESIAKSATATDRERAHAAQTACRLTRTLFKRISDARQKLVRR